MTGESWDTAYEISNAAELALLAKRVNNGESGNWRAKHYRLTNDIFLAQHQWMPIDFFDGGLDGNNHTIYGLTMNVDENFPELQSGAGVALIGTAQNAEVKNLNLRDGLIRVENTFSGGDIYVGSLAGINEGKITNVTSNVTVYNNFNSNDFCNAGGLVGYNMYEISFCKYTGMVYANNINGGCVGGLVGYAELADPGITNCMVDAYVGGKNSVGALVGSSYSSSISNCVAIGTIDGPGSILMGENMDGGDTVITACSFYGSATHDDLTLPEGAVACYAVVNERRLLSSDLEDPSWAENWVVVPELNNGLPMQKGLFWIGCEIVTPVEKFKEALAGFKEPDAAA